MMNAGWAGGTGQSVRNIVQSARRFPRENLVLLGVSTQERTANLLMSDATRRTVARVVSMEARPSTVFLPREHGSWSLALEPLALGMLLAPSLAGGAFLAATVAVFFARRPFKMSFSHEPVGNWRESREALVMLSGLAVAGVFEALVFSNLRSFWPLVIAAPFGLLFGWYDAKGDGRAAAAELLGTAAFGLLPAVFATLAGFPPKVALTFAVLALIRSIPTVLTVRDFLRRRKGQRSSALLPCVAAMAAVFAATALALTHQSPWVAAVGALLLFMRTVWMVSPWRPQWSARRVGVMESVLGGVYVAIVAVGYRVA